MIDKKPFLQKMANIGYNCVSHKVKKNDVLYVLEHEQGFDSLKKYDDDEEHKKLRSEIMMLSGVKKNSKLYKTLVKGQP